MLKQKLASIIIQIIFIHNLCKKLTPAYNLHTISLKTYEKEIISIL